MSEEDFEHVLCQHFPAHAVYQAALWGCVDDLQDIMILSDELSKILMLEWTDDTGRTALIIATQQGNYECVSALLAEGANVDHMCTYQSGGTALHFAVRMKHSRRIVQELLLHGADPFVENLQGVTPCDICRTNGHSGSAMFAGHALLEGWMYIKDSKRGLSKNDSKPFWIEVVPRHGCPILNSGRPSKCTLDIQLYIHQRHFTEEICEVDLTDCYAELVADKTDTVCDVLLTCPSSSVLSCNERLLGGISKGRVATLWLRGENELLERFVSMVNMRDVSMFDRSTNDAELDVEDATTVQHDFSELSVDGLHSNGKSTSSPAPRTSIGHLMTDPRMQPSGTSTIPRCSAQGQLKEQGTWKTPRGMGHYKESDQHHKIDQSQSHCVICLDKPRTVGFVHGESMHTCSCEDCAETISKGSNRCPLCREVIQHIVKRIY